MPNKNNNRIGRIDEEYRKELSQIIGYELKNPNITGLISVTKGFECGMQIENYNDIKEGDQIEVYVMEEIKR